MNDYFKQLKDANKNMHPLAKVILVVVVLAIAGFLVVKFFNKPEILLMVFALYTGMVFHEVAHGYAALKMGDPTAKIWGRLTLNPIKHIDPVGLALPIILNLINAGFAIGWAKGVPVNYDLLKRRSLGIFIVSTAGVFVNFICVVVATLLLKLLELKYIKIGLAAVFQNYRIDFMDPKAVIAVLLSYIVIFNLQLIIFNIIPIPPLDGSKILYSFSGRKVREFIDSMEKFGFLILMALLYFKVLDIYIYPAFKLGLKVVVFALGLSTE